MRATACTRRWGGREPYGASGILPAVPSTDVVTYARSTTGGALSEGLCAHNRYAISPSAQLCAVRCWLSCKSPIIVWAKPGRVDGHSLDRLWRPTESNLSRRCFVSSVVWWFLLPCAHREGRQQRHEKKKCPDYAVERPICHICPSLSLFDACACTHTVKNHGPRARRPFALLDPAQSACW